MSEKRYIVCLTEAERIQLMDVIKAKRMAARKRTRAEILLMVDEGELGPSWSDRKAAEAYHSHVNRVHSLRRRFVERGFEAALERKPQERPSRQRKLDETAERELLAIAQDEPPDGRVRWTLHLLADRLVQLKIVDNSISHETVRKALKKTTSSHNSRSHT